MKVDIEQLYNEHFFRNRAAKYGWRAPIVCKAVVDAMRLEHGLEVQSACDVGCAVGDLVQGFRELGIKAYGIEGSTAAEPYLVCQREDVMFHDLRRPLPEHDSTTYETLRGERFEVTIQGMPRVDVVTCFEVAEHLEPEYADVFLDTLASLSDNLVMSACPPHPTKKPTRYHPHEAPAEYWYNALAKRGYQQDAAVEKLLRAIWYPWRHKYGIKAFWDNLLCARKPH